MFGFDVVTTLAALVALATLLAAVPLLLAKNFVQLAGALFIGGAAWTVGNLTATTFAGVSAAAVATFILWAEEVVAALGFDLPFSVGAIVLLVAAIVVLGRARGNGKKK